MTAEKEKEEVVFSLNIDGSNVDIYPNLKDQEDPKYAMSHLVMSTIRHMNREVDKLIHSIYFTNYGTRRRKPDAKRQSKTVNPQISEINDHLKIMKGKVSGEIKTIKDREGKIVGFTFNSKK